jgi:hypothetical protein
MGTHGNLEGLSLWRSGGTLIASAVADNNFRQPEPRVWWNTSSPTDARSRPRFARHADGLTGRGDRRRDQTKSMKLLSILQQLDTGNRKLVLQNAAAW